MSVSGLSREHVIKARALAMQAASLGVAHSPSIHYTQGSQRWDGIRHGLKAWRGEYPHWADCSAYVTWCLWNGLSHYHAHDHVNGQNWAGGYTGTLATHGQQVHSNFQHGDLCLYGSGFPFEHVAIYVGGGLVISHGSERGPLKCSMHYRPDLRQVRRYV
jgi:cell wall-associated NlpC family hydrolase